MLIFIDSAFARTSQDVVYTSMSWCKCKLWESWHKVLINDIIIRRLQEARKPFLMDQWRHLPMSQRTPAPFIESWLPRRPESKLIILTAIAE